MKLPVRKCYYVAKVSFIIILVCLILSLFEHYRGGRKTVQAQTEQNDFEKLILEDERRIIPDLGEGGVAAHLFGDAKRLGEESEKQLAINVYLSDRIPYNRSLEEPLILPDHRNPACKRVLYDAELPSASVIIIFHNEPYSVVVRTLWSVVNSARRNQPWYRRVNAERNTGSMVNVGYPGQDPSSPFVYLKEIILVDDNSTLPELKGKLSHYIRTRLPPDLIKILRLPDRQGLMRARIRGARKARGDVLIFLDAHCEAGPDWLRPLLQRILHKRDAVVTPLIDVIDQATFRLEAAEQFQVGGFTFMGHFTWIDVPEWEKKRRGSDISPTWSPTMAGGLFAINRQYYWELGAYDEQMAGWGGENLEMSFRIWQCGGTLETIPCSRVGHVFRSFHPYGLPAHTDTHGINTARMAEVWMDDYAELFYLHRPDLRNNPKIGDVTHRKILREKLKCKSFAWYLQHVYKDKFVPVRDVFGFGRFRSPSGLCLDSLQREGEGSALGAYPCHASLEATQYFALSLIGQLRDEERCAELQYTRRVPGEGEASRRVLMVSCHGKLRGQKWRYLPSKQLQHVESGLCLTSPREAGGDVTAAKCVPAVDQKWTIDYTEENDFRLDSKSEPSEQELRLQRLRGQRRISRSLLANETDQRRHRKGKKRRKKDRFVLKLVRKVNGSEEHLEADVYCKHRTLYPNNSFVRDIVGLLNDRDITVINNGRVFEKHRITPLHPHTHSHKHKESKQKKPKKEKKPEVQIKSGNPVNPDKGVVRLNQEEKKIIIEDFVELTPQPTVTPKKKRKHPKKAILPTLSNDMLKPISVEDAPLQENTMTLPRVYSDSEPRRHSTNVDPESIYKRYDESDDDPSDDDDKPRIAGDQTDVNQDIADLNQMRVDDVTNDIRKDSIDAYQSEASDSKDTVLKERDAADTNDLPMAKRADGGSRYKLVSGGGDDGQHSEERYERVTRQQSSDGRPVRLVMRSNLTFNIGDEFFNWKLDADDVATLLGELSLPNKTTERATTLRSTPDSSSESSSEEM